MRAFLSLIIMASLSGGGLTDEPTVLMCEVFNRHKASAECRDGNASCTHTAECSGSQTHRPACMAVEKDGHVELKGCWTWEPASACLPYDQCNAYETAKETNVHFCCCTQPLCNHNVVIKEGLHSTHLLPNHMPDVKSERSSVPKIVGYTIVPLVVVAFAVILVYFCVRRFQYRALKSKAKYIPPSGAPLMTVHSMPLSAEKVTSNPIMAVDPPPLTAPPAARNVQKIKLVAQGRFGQVWMGSTGSAPDVMYVAIKVFPAEDADSWVQEQEIYSLEAMRSHENIVRYVGSDVVGIGASAEYWLMTEFHSNLSLHHYLKTHTLSASELLRVSIGTLAGLAYLHEELIVKDASSGLATVIKPTIAHRDFKSGNVLLDEHLTPRIADFGLAIQCRHGKTSSDAQGHQVGTRRYMAPEVLERATEFSAVAYRRIDVYACALVLWECVSRTRVPGVHVNAYMLPFESEVGLQPTVEQMCSLVCKNARRPAIEARWRRHSEVATICTTMEEMWETEADSRVTAGCACERFMAMEHMSDDSAIDELSTRPPDTTPLINQLNRCNNPNDATVESN